MSNPAGRAAPGCEAAGLAWPHPLFAYQKTGIATLLGASSLLLADEMGLGKTIQVIAALRILIGRGEVRRALVVCPAGLIIEWRRHFRLWAPEVAISTAIGLREERHQAWRRDAAVYLAGYDALCSDVSLPRDYGPGRRCWDVVVLDEAQRIKNPDTDAAIFIKRLHRIRSWALTGTPLENHLGDLVSVLEFVAPNRRDPAAMAMGVRRLLAEVQLRRRRRAVMPDLPSKFVTTTTVALSGRQREAYRRAEQQGIVWFRSLGAELHVAHVLELILRLKQICNFCPQSDQSAKLADLRRRLSALADTGEKALIFSQFAEEPFGARRLARELADFHPLVLVGSLSREARAAIIGDFAHDPARRVLIASLRTGGLGLNLTAASCVFHFDRWWNPALETQAEDRAHRIGQRRPVQVFAYLCHDTVEERIDRILTEKRALFADVIDGVNASVLERLNLDILLQAAVPGFYR
ncbi:MAG TPA: DEAD/DEAH box helicase [Stellaceae bacterium]|nr:DEAD/DEAH box helicase [Stellaceae bacterium]